MSQEFDWYLKYRLPEGESYWEHHRSVCYGVLQDLKGHMSWKRPLMRGASPELIVAYHEPCLETFQVVRFLKTLDRSPLARGVCMRWGWEEETNRIRLEHMLDAPEDVLVSMLIAYRHVHEKPGVIKSFDKLFRELKPEDSKQLFFTLGLALAFPLDRTPIGKRQGFLLDQASMHRVMNPQHGINSMAKFALAMYSGDSESKVDNFLDSLSYGPNINHLFLDKSDDVENNLMENWTGHYSGVIPKDEFLEVGTAWLSKFRRGDLL